MLIILFVLQNIYDTCLIHELIEANHLLKKVKSVFVIYIYIYIYIYV